MTRPLEPEDLQRAFRPLIGEHLALWTAETLALSLFHGSEDPDRRAIGRWADENPGSRRVYHPRSRVVRAGFGLVVSEGKEVLLIQRNGGRRAGKWSLPGGNAERGKSRRSAAVRGTRKATGIEFTPERLYYEKRHDAQIWLGSPPTRSPRNFSGRWFPIDELPYDDSLAFAIDVRTIESGHPRTAEAVVLAIQCRYACEGKQGVIDWTGHGTTRESS